MAFSHELSATGVKIYAPPATSQGCL